MLEQQLDEVNQVERAELYPGSSCNDANKERRLCDAEVDTSLAEYGNIRLRSSVMTPFGAFIAYIIDELV